ncbi:flippase [soil metagenome]
MLPFFNEKILFIKSKFSANKKIGYSLFYTFLFHGSNFIIPIIIIPYLLRTIGIEKFGLVAFAQAIMTYFTIFTDYGFQISGTKEVSVNRESSGNLSKIVSKVFCVKLLLLIISFLVLLLLTTVIKKLNEEQTLLLFSFFITIGRTILPHWFFQGLEKMQYMALLNFISKPLVFIFIIIFIKSEADYIYVNLIYSAGEILIAIIGIFMMFLNFKIRISFLGVKEILEELRKGWYIFLSNFSINIYMNANIIILSLFVNDYILGVYGLAEKIMQVMKQVNTVIFQTVFPHACKLAEESLLRLKQFFKQAFTALSIIFLFMGAVVFIFAGEILFILSGERIEEGIDYLRFFAFVPLIVSLNIPSYQTLLIYDLHKTITKIIFSGAIINLVLNFTLASQFQAMGTISSIFLTEVFVTSGLLYLTSFKYDKYNFLIFQRKEAVGRI